MAAGQLTIEEYEQLPDTLAVNFELVEGELVDVSGNIPIHNFLRDLLLRLLANFVEEHSLGTVLSEQEYDFDGNAHGPDLSFFQPDKREALQMYARVQRFVPDLAIEIASPDDKFDALFKKCDRYRRCGTQETWLFSMETRRVFVSREGSETVLHENDVLSSSLLPGFSTTLKQMLDRLL